jgi:YVTN family beta-propeller protein
MSGEDQAEDRLRELLHDPRWSLPAWRDPEQRIRKAARRQRLRLIGMTAGAAAAAVIAVAIPVGTGALGHLLGPTAPHRTVPTVYVAYDISHGARGTPVVIPISTATNTVGRPIKVGDGPTNNAVGQIAITPGGKTAYVVNFAGTVIPISTATNRAGKPIHVGPRPPSVGPHAGGLDFIAITPDGKTAYVANTAFNTVTPINTATNTAGKPIRVGSAPAWIAITPDGKTAYVANETHNEWTPGTVTPINTATNKAGKPIPVGDRVPDEIAITPDGKTAYVLGVTSSSRHVKNEVTPISTATNTPGKPIQLTTGLGGYGFIAVTPDGTTAYVTTGYPRTVIPISTVTDTPGKPIAINEPNTPAGYEIAITPDGKTAYVVSSGYNYATVTPINTATNTVGRPIKIGSSCQNAHLIGISDPKIVITPDGKTAYLACQDSVIPISTATNTTGKPIPVAPGYPMAIAIMP